MAEQRRPKQKRRLGESPVKEKASAVRVTKGFTAIDLLVTICLIVLLTVVLLPAVRRVHTSYSTHTGAEALFEAIDKSGPAHMLLEEDAGADYHIRKSGPCEECWLVLYDPNCDHQVIVFKTLVPAPDNDQTL